MSRLKQKILQQAKQNDRRFSKGIVCRIIHNDTIVSAINRNYLLPPGTFLSLSIRGISVAISTDRGLYFAVPISVQDKLEDELNNYTIENESSMISFLKQNMIMARVPAVKCPGSNPLVDPNNFDILIETVDVSETLDAIFVPRSQFDYTKKRELKDG